jgi:hypothetical protein
MSIASPLGDSQGASGQLDFTFNSLGSREGEFALVLEVHEYAAVSVADGKFRLAIESNPAQDIPAAGIGFYTVEAPAARHLVLDHDGPASSEWGGMSLPGKACRPKIGSREPIKAKRVAPGGETGAPSSGL